MVNAFTAMLIVQESFRKLNKNIKHARTFDAVYERLKMAWNSRVYMGLYAALFKVLINAETSLNVKMFLVFLAGRLFLCRLFLLGWLSYWIQSVLLNQSYFLVGRFLGLSFLIIGTFLVNSYYFNFK